MLEAWPAENSDQTDSPLALDEWQRTIDIFGAQDCNLPRDF